MLSMVGWSYIALVVVKINALDHSFMSFEIIFASYWELPKGSGMGGKEF